MSLLARATVRRREMGLRAALGAGRSRLIRQMLTETVLLGLLGGVGGIIVGNWFNPGDVSRLMSTSLPVRLDFEFRLARVCVLFRRRAAQRNRDRSVARLAILPRRRSQPAAGRRTKRYRRRERVTRLRGMFWWWRRWPGRSILLVIAGLLVRSLQHAGNIHLGFDPSHVLNVSVDPHEIGYDEKQQREFYRRLEDRVRAMPGVQSVSLAYGMPMGSITSVNAGSVSIQGHPVPPGQQPPVVFFNNVDAGYLQTMRVPLRRGRDFTQSDKENAPRVAIVNDTMAEKFWPHEDPIGKIFTLKGLAAPAQTMQVVGVTETGKYATMFEDPTAFFYVPLAQNFISGQTLQVRTLVAPESVITPVRDQIRRLAPDLPIVGTSTMQDIVEGTNGLQIFRFGAYFCCRHRRIGFVFGGVGRLWCRLVRCGAAHARDRDSHGARRHRTRCLAAGVAAGRRDGAGRFVGRHPRCIGTNPRDDPLPIRD